MGGNDPLVEVVERHGIHTYSTEQIAVKLLDLCTAESRAEAVEHPLDVDLTGGLGNAPIDIKVLRAEAMADAEKAAASAQQSDDDSTSAKTAASGLSIKRCPARTCRSRRRSTCRLAERTAKPETRSSSVSIGELGPWGSGRTRFEAELGIHSDAASTCPPARWLELAWNMGLVEWQDSPKPVGTTPTATSCPKRHRRALP